MQLALLFAAENWPPIISKMQTSFTLLIILRFLMHDTDAAETNKGKVQIHMSVLP